MKLKAKYLLMLPILLGLSGHAFSQGGSKSLYFWKFNTVSGQVGLQGLYREQERVVADFQDTEKSYFLSGGIQVRTNSSILNPNFLVLDLDGAYMPGTNRQNYIVTPDQSEVCTVKKLNLGALFFQQKQVSLKVVADYDQSFSARENLTDVKSVNRHWGALLSYTNKYLPVSIGFHSRKWDETEIQSGRKYSIDQKLFETRITKSFTKADRNEFRYSHDYNLNINQNLFRVANTIDNIDFTSHIKPGGSPKYNLNTVISEIHQRGYTNFNRFQAGENVNLQLPKQLVFNGGYNFYSINQDLSNLVQHNLNTSLGQSLFKSLQSKIFLDYSTINHSVYKETTRKTGFEINYSKKIPFGQLLISYKFDRLHQDYKSDPSLIAINNESYTLGDGKIELLRLADITLSSVVVKDETGTLIYENGLDYVLIERGSFIEIRRVPGGLIVNNSTILVDYTALQPGSYMYNANSNVFNTSVYLFKNKLSFYYRFSNQDYYNMESTQSLALNYFTQNLVGCRFDFGFLDAGAEYEDYKSTILPYHMMRYYANIQRTLGQKLILMLNGNLQNYVMLDKPEPEYQNFMDITGKAIYSIFRQTNLNIDLMYRKQTGQGIDLDLLSLKSEITSQLNLLYLTFGLELYKRNYVGEVVNFRGTYVKLIRKF
jgi:hypothetical protein